MKLVQIFANKHFIPVEFKAGFNVVIARITQPKANKDTHNLGKSSLISVINFLMLGKMDRKNDTLFRHKWFDGVVFFGEFRLNDGRYVLIKRGLSQATKVSFRVNTIPHTPQDWTFEDLAFERARDYLNTLLALDATPSYPFRKSIGYFLRSQADYAQVFQIGKYFKGKDQDWKPFMFELLGYDGELIRRKYKANEEIIALRGAIKLLKKEKGVLQADRYKLEGLLQIRKEEAAAAAAEIDRFNFFEADLLRQRDLVDRLDVQLQAAVADRYRCAFELQRTQASLEDVQGEVAADTLTRLFEETALYFPDDLRRRYEDLSAFQTAISRERKHYLRQNLSRLQQEEAALQAEIQLLEREREQSLAFLTEWDSFEKFKGLQKQLAKQSGDIATLEEKLRSLDSTAVMEAEIAAMQESLKDFREAIDQELKRNRHAEIRSLFNELIKDVLGTNALLLVRLNGQGNVDFEADFIDREAIVTSEARGTTYKKILCAAFDLALLIHYAQRSFFRFVYHDGILEGLDDRIKVRLLDKVKDICQRHQLQYVLTLIDSDIPQRADGSAYPFSDAEICLELHDRDDSGRLFQHKF